MLYRAVLIFPDSENLAGFIESLQLPGEVDGKEYSFAGNLTEEQIKRARVDFGAYVRVARVVSGG